MMSSGDHLPVDVIEALRQGMPALDIHTVYGMTELAGRFCALPPTRVDELKGSVGRPMPGLNVTVAGSDGRPLPVGEEGEIWNAGGEFERIGPMAPSSGGIPMPNTSPVGDAIARGDGRRRNGGLKRVQLS